MVVSEKPRVLLDVDGVLADFLTKALEVLNSIGHTNFQHDDVKDWDIFNCLGISKEIENRCYDVFKTRGYALNLQAYAGSHEAVAALLKHADLYIVTSPIMSETWMYDRTKWLGKEFNIPEKRIIHAASKYVIAGDFLIDDKPSNVRLWQDQHPTGHGVLWAQIYNKNVDINFRRTNSWKEIIDQVKKFKR